jgi:hypothetical protein
MRARSVVVVALVSCSAPAKPVPVPPANKAPPPAATLAAPVGPGSVWWCFKTVPLNAECVPERKSCDRDADEMRGGGGVTSVSTCSPFATVWCHQFADDPGATPLCYPGPEYCDAGRKLMGGAGSQTACVTAGPPGTEIAVGAAPPPPRPPPPSNGFWCFETVPMNAECVREQAHCTKDANEMRGYQNVKSVSQCAFTASTWCHQYADDPDANPLCYPTPAYCENGRKLMSGGDAKGTGQTPCVPST